ncbi:SUKH-3 domain-containing protein [Actinoplanes xinjiangensis]|uniref:SUKH-3 immunity protein of toxin-antitoxin system n=1 Tax=Actinoplanes xinjiangensis TaxID=512350 RepID=A0A316F3P3_9ACTN|nr:SUKH-3 domain-containing protein [Actinoplanes xinjiangensis]PWK39577.1 SUKH-3 immunity protein of toxin-antitoxin system [Actinoplanes xinjiangensis]GIF42560.1 hypothetical protein Axi01nite_68710 [Actinoplanes xinjiangensis]
MSCRSDEFGADLKATLSVAGWAPDRRVDVTPWVVPMEREGYRVHDLARDVLSSLGGLSVDPVKREGPNFVNDEPFNFDPFLAASGQLEIVTRLEQLLGGSYSPLGEWTNYLSVYIESRGRVVMVGGGYIWELGRNLEEALRLALFAERRLVCLHSEPEVEPWPDAEI